MLAKHRELSDAEVGSQYTLKICRSKKDQLPDGTWRHRRITLEPDSTDPSFEPIVLENVSEDEFEIVAEVVEVLG